MNAQAISEFIKKTRKENGMTQQDIATKLNISPQAVSKWERGECLPDIALFPEIADIFNIKVEELFYVGQTDELDIFKVMDMINGFISDKLFQRIEEEFMGANQVADVRVPLDIFLLINNKQKDKLLDILLTKQDYIHIADDILPYTNNTQRQKLVEHILAKKDYGNIEPLVPFMTNAIKTEIVQKLLFVKKFEYIEEILPLLGREHKDLIIQFVLNNRLNQDILENYLPFFDGKQRNLIRNHYSNSNQ